MRISDWSSDVCSSDLLSQVDLPLGNKSGLRDAVEALDSVEGVAFIEFAAADVVRHPLVTRIVHAYNRREGSLLPTTGSRCTTTRRPTTNLDLPPRQPLLTITWSV